MITNNYWNNSLIPNLWWKWSVSLGDEDYPFWGLASVLLGLVCQPPQSQRTSVSTEQAVGADERRSSRWRVQSPACSPDSIIPNRGGGNSFIYDLVCPCVGQGTFPPGAVKEPWHLEIRMQWLFILLCITVQCTNILIITIAVSKCLLVLFHFIHWDKKDDLTCQNNHRGHKSLKI